MTSINNVDGFDPLSNDSMDPTDPNSIMYDPSLAEKSNVIVGPNGQIIVIPDTDNRDQKSESDLSVNSLTSDISGAAEARQEEDVGKKLRRFGRSNS